MTRLADAAVFPPNPDPWRLAAWATLATLAILILWKVVA